MGLKLTNNAVSRLSAGITASSTSISLVPGEGLLFPTLAAGDYFPATLVKADGSIEIVKVTARSTDTLTVVRAQEGTTAKSFTAGDRIEVRLTAGTLKTINAVAEGALPKAGGTMAGDLTMGAGTKIVMEGTTDDANEVTIDPGNPTADRTLTLPDKSGTVATTDDVSQSLPKSGGTLTGDLTMGAGTKIVMEGTTDDAFEVTVDPGNPTADRTLSLPNKSGTLATEETSVQKDSNTGAATMPVGTTAQRPASPSSGMYRMNSTTGEPEWYDPTSSTWVNFRKGAPYTVEYLVVAGGGGGGGGASTDQRGGGGGGAGGLLTGSISVGSGTSYPVIVGAGGSGYGFSAYFTNGTAGSASSALSASAVGGGYGGGFGNVGGNGGSGGGTGGGASPGSGTSGQGYAGGTSSSASYFTGSAGGGAGGVGSNAKAKPGNTTGGVGVSSSISGAASTYAAGGNGGQSTSVENGQANTGNGGSGEYSGGSGIVIIRYLGEQRGSGGTVTSSGGYTIHTFTSSGTFTS